jgi:hypothetical protein
VPALFAVSLVAFEIVNGCTHELTRPSRDCCRTEPDIPILKQAKAEYAKVQ